MTNKIEKDQVLLQAKRCIKCKNPRCKQGCPINTAIPEIIELLLKNETQEAGEVLFRNNPLSVICSLVCPHENQCEGNCILGIKGEAVKIGEIEHYISTEYLTKKACAKESINSGKIAIVGSGPAGLSIAFILAIKGYDVVIFEAHDKIGGVLRYGIPEFRLPKTILDHLKKQLIKLGVKIRPNTLIGPVLTIEDLFRDRYDAVFIGTGVWNPKKLDILGETLGNVHYAIDYLKNPEVYDLGQRVCIIGAGNVAMDAARTAVRQGIQDVTVMYRKGREDMSATTHEIECAISEGVKFRFHESPVELTDRGVSYQLTKDTDTSEKLFEVDSMIIAVSQGPKSNIVSRTKDIVTSKKGLVVTDDCGRTTKEGVFASGDVVTGAKTVVEAVSYSKKVAEAIHSYVQGNISSSD